MFNHGQTGDTGPTERARSRPSEAQSHEENEVVKQLVGLEGVSSHTHVQLEYVGERWW